MSEPTRRYFSAGRVFDLEWEHRPLSQLWTDADDRLVAELVLGGARGACARGVPPRPRRHPPRPCR